jgi:hypothetical protein
MRTSDWTGWLAVRKLFTSRGTATRRPTPTLKPQLETLENRLVPTVLDLTTVGSIGTLGSGIFEQNATQPSGSGVIDAFVRLQAKHASSGIAQGYNTDARPVQFDEKVSPVFTRSLQLSNVPLVNVGGTPYREFLLDINQTNSTPLLSLDELRFYDAGLGNLTGYDPNTHLLSGIAPSFDIGAGNWIKLNSGLNPGSGKANMVALVPDSAFAGAPAGSFVYLYSKFGVNLPAHGGFEQWAVHSNTALTPQTGFISGSIFNDLGGTGSFVPGDQGLAGWVVTLTDAGTGRTVTTTTDANGDFLFSNLATGLGQFSTYTISVVPPSGWTATTPSSFTFSLQNSGQSATGVDFGEIFNPSTSPPSS